MLSGIGGAGTVVLLLVALVVPIVLVVAVLVMVPVVLTVLVVPGLWWYQHLWCFWGSWWYRCTFSSSGLFFESMSNPFFPECNSGPLYFVHHVRIPEEKQKMFKPRVCGQVFPTMWGPILECMMYPTPNVGTNCWT